MGPTLWVLVAIKIFILFWLIYYIFERRKKKGSVSNLVVTEQGVTYAGAPVTQISKGYNDYNQQHQFCAASANVMPSKVQPPTAGMPISQSTTMK